MATFFVTARTEPVEPAPDKYGSGTSLVLYGAPSEAAAVGWAQEYVEKLLLWEDSGQQLRELKVVPFCDRWLTSQGGDPIDWVTLIAQRPDEHDAYAVEFHSSMAVQPPDSTSSDSDGSDENVMPDIETIREMLPNADQWNWDAAKEFLYVFHHEQRAFLVRAMNMLVAAHPYLTATRNTPDGAYQASVCRWPGVREYHSSDV